MPNNSCHITLGVQGENVASQFLAKKGYRIITRNYKVTIGEIDIIAEEGGDLVFIEIKTRSGTQFGLPSEAVGLHKQRKIIKVAQWYLTVNDCFDRSLRFDVVSVLMKRGDKPDIEVIQHAFGL